MWPKTAEASYPAPTIVPRPEHPISRKDITVEALKVLYRLHHAGFKAYLVGGSVRDLFLGKRPKDFDLATDARPGEVRKLFRNSRIIGRRFRLVLKGLGAVPIWFVSRNQYNAAKADGVLTIGELQTLSSLIRGSAQFYTETLRPEGPSVRVPLKTTEAMGALEDGSNFSLKIIWAGTPSEPIVTLVTITFK